MGRIFGREEHLWRIYKENVKRMTEKKQEEEGRGIKKREKEFQEGEDSGKLEEEKRRPTSGHSEIVSADGQIDSRRAPGGALSMPRTSTQPTPTLGHRWCPSPARSTAPGGVEDIRTRERGRRSGGRSSVGNVRCQ